MRRVALALVLCLAWPAFAVADPPRAKQGVETGGKQGQHHFQGLNQGVKESDKKQKDPIAKTGKQ
jgi:hypothetical protein